MSVWAVVLTIGISLVVALTAATLTARHFARSASQYPTILESPRYPCYRCGEIPGEMEFMGLHYCMMCRLVVVQVYPMVKGDAPFGFPGAPGYLDWPERLVEEKKKEA